MIIVLVICMMSINAMDNSTYVTKDIETDKY